MGRQLASRSYKTKRYSKDTDRILNEDLKDKAALHALKNQTFDEYLPGLGQHFCVTCAKYFETNVALKTHERSKVHKREVKNIKFGPYTSEEAAAAAGRDVEKYLAKKQQQIDLQKGDAATQELNSVRKHSHLKRKPIEDAMDAQTIEGDQVEQNQEIEADEQQVAPEEEISV